MGLKNIELIFGFDSLAKILQGKYFIAYYIFFVPQLKNLKL